MGAGAGLRVGLLSRSRPADDRWRWGSFEDVVEGRGGQVEAAVLVGAFAAEEVGGVELEGEEVGLFAGEPGVASAAPDMPAIPQMKGTSCRVVQDGAAGRRRGEGRVAEGGDGL